MVCLHYFTLLLQSKNIVKLRCVYITLRYGVFTLHYVMVCLHYITVCLHYITLRCVYSARSKWAKLPAEKPQINFPKRSDISPCKYLNYSLIHAILPSPPFSSTSSSSPSSSVFHPTNNFAKKSMKRKPALQTHNVNEGMKTRPSGIEPSSKPFSRTGINN